MSELEGGSRVVVVKAGGLGDLLAATPALRALRRALPEAEITLVTKAWLAPFCARYGSLNRVLVAPPCPGVGDPPFREAECEDFCQRLRSERIDLAVQFQGHGALSNGFLLRLGARFTAGFCGPDAPKLDFCLPFDSRQHEVLRFLDLLDLIGVPADGWEMDLPLTHTDEAELAALLGLLGKRELEERRCLGLNVSAGGASRQWPVDRFAAVANQLLARYSLAGVVVSAGPGQEERASQTVASISPRYHAVNVSGRLSLGGLAALISRLRLLVSTDSGPAHMAVALGTPSVTVFGAGHPANWAPLARTWNRLAATWHTPCRWLEHDGCPEAPTVPCLLGVSVEQVVAEASNLLELLDRLSDSSLPAVDTHGTSPIRLSYTVVGSERVVVQQVL